MTTSPNCQPSTIDTLTTRIAVLRQEHNDLLYHHRELLARGIGSQTGELHDRLAEITAEIIAIRRRLHTINPATTGEHHHDPERQDNNP